MHVIFIKNYKYKLLYSAAVFFLILAVFFISKSSLYNKFAFHITIDESISFSCPAGFKVDKIYLNESMENSIITTSSNLSRPIADKFSSYKSIEGKFSFSYPSAFTLKEKDFSGSDILYHIDIENKAMSSHGFIQVWNMPYSLKEFLDKSKDASEESFKNFQSKPVSINGLPGYLWEYTSITSTGNVKAHEVFLKNNNKMYRISYFAPEAYWNKSQEDTFWDIAKSFKILN